MVSLYVLPMRVLLNGESRQVSDGVTVSELVAELGLGQRRIAVEVNRDILPNDAYENHALCDGDIVEIVQCVGGG